MPIASVLAFWLVAALLIVVPGADWAFTIRSAVRGHTAVVAAVGGLVIGYAAMTAVVAAGLGSLVAGMPAALSILTFAGGGYLMWHGVMTIAHPASAASAAGTANTASGSDRASAANPTSSPGAVQDLPAGSSGATLVQGIGVSGLNPKALLLFLALLPQFTKPDESWPIGIQMAVLGGVFTASCAVFYLVLGSWVAAVLGSRPMAARAVSRGSGGGMFLIGAGLIAERIVG